MWFTKLWPNSVRSRLLWLAMLVQVIMLAVLIGRTAVVFEEGLLEQSKACVGRLTPALEAALISPLLQEDVATVQNVVRLAAKAPGVVYLAFRINLGLFWRPKGGLKTRAFRRRA